MVIDSDTLIFFDASCLIAGTYSLSGGSGFLLRLCEHQFLEGAVSQPVLIEAERNIKKKFGQDLLTTYHELLESIPLLYAPVPPPEKIELDPGIVENKDMHVLSAALSAEVEYLLTLDQALEHNINKNELNIKAYSPGDFIKQVLVNHTDYPELRNDVS